MTADEPPEVGDPKPPTTATRGLPEIAAKPPAVPDETEPTRRGRGRRRIPAKDRAQPYSISLTPADLRAANAECRARGISGLTRLFRTLLEESSKGAVRNLRQYYQAREADWARIIDEQAMEIERLRKSGAKPNPQDATEGE